MKWAYHKKWVSHLWKARALTFWSCGLKRLVNEAAAGHHVLCPNSHIMSRWHWKDMSCGLPTTLSLFSNLLLFSIYLACLFLVLLFLPFILLRPRSIKVPKKSKSSIFPNYSDILCCRTQWSIVMKNWCKLLTCYIPSLFIIALTWNSKLQTKRNFRNEALHAVLGQGLILFQMAKYDIQKSRTIWWWPLYFQFSFSQSDLLE